ncbi:(2Fe-2S)-binding protein [[Eubacterium] cellulosolvens]
MYALTIFRGTQYKNYPYYGNRYIPITIILRLAIKAKMGEFEKKSEENIKLSEEKKPEKKGVSRRGFIQGAVAGLVVGAAATYGATTMMQPPKPAPPTPGAPAEVVGPMVAKMVTMTINGVTVTNEVMARWTLQKYLRDVVGLVGTIEGCDNAACGACTVIVNGMSILSCSMLAMDCEGADITTIEGLASGGNLSSIQQSFINNTAFQCGGCTPGFIMAGKALKDKKSSPSEDEVREAVSGVLCRCGTYERVVKAIMEA